MTIDRKEFDRLQPGDLITVRDHTRSQRTVIVTAPPRGGKIFGRPLRSSPKIVNKRPRNYTSGQVTRLGPGNPDDSRLKTVRAAVAEAVKPVETQIGEGQPRQAAQGLAGFGGPAHPSIEQATSPLSRPLTGATGAGLTAARTPRSSGVAVIRVVDLETTGFEPPNHTVCEIGWCDLLYNNRDGVRDAKQWKIVPGGSMLVSPGRPIPPEASAVHHLTDQDVAKAAPWKHCASAVFGSRKKPGEIVAFAAHEARFERQWCTDEITGGRPWICTYKCALRVWPKAPAHSNQALRYWLKPADLDRAIADAGHRAYPDAYVTTCLLRELLAHATYRQLVQWSTEPALQYRCQIGKKWRGFPWEEVDDGYLEWILEPNRNFDEDVRFTARHELERRKRLVPNTSRLKKRARRFIPGPSCAC
jgi:exodeoxyribonuclease X